jgi:hypothetical protein
MRRFRRLTFVIALAGAFLLPGPLRHALAQSTAIEVEIVLDETYFLPGEEIPVGVRISNLSGRPITLGTTTNWLTFFAESRAGDIVNRTGFVPVQGEFTLESSKAGLKFCNIQPYFDFEQAGPYLIYAEVRLPDWNQRLVSDPATINLQSARKLWEVRFGVPPDPANTNAAPEIRRYALQSATRTKDRKLYARVADETDSHIYRVVSLDRLLSFSNPEQQLDGASRLHVLFQTGGNTYTYCIVDHHGELVGRERHEIVPGSRPRLAKLPDGVILVQGGRRSPSISDIPPYVPPPQLTPTNAAPVVVTNLPPKTAKEKREERRSARQKEREAAR